MFIHGYVALGVVSEQVDEVLRMDVAGGLVLSELVNQLLGGAAIGKLGFYDTEEDALVSWDWD